MKIRVLSAWLAAFAAGILMCSAAEAKIVTKTIDYQQEGKTFKGYLAYDDAKKGARPGILVIHEWWGLNDFVKDRARALAKLGYIAFAADMYGDAQVTRDAKEAGAWSGAVRKEPGLLAARAKAGLAVLRKQPQLDQKHVGAMGFCFGGSTVLALAYSGEPLQGVVTFHGSLFAPDETQAKDIKTSIVILTGAEDAFIKPETIDNVRKSFDAANVDWYMVTYAGAHHAFTNPDADNYKLDNIAYNEKAAKRSWAEMEHFFKLQFAKR
jgi:dienelactone hydrolase